MIDKVKNYIFIIFVSVFIVACSDDDSQQITPPSSQKATLVQSNINPLYKEDGYLSASGYELDFIFLNHASEFIEKHRKEFSHDWASAYDCEYAERIKNEDKDSLDSLAETILQDAMDEASNYPSKLKEITKMDILPYSNEAGLLKPILYHKRYYYGDRETDGCKIPRRMRTEYENYLYVMLSKDVDVEIPDLFSNEINDGAKSVRVDAIIKYRVDSISARYYSTSGKKYKGYNKIVVEEMELYKNKDDMNNEKPFKILYEADLYDS